MDDEARRTLHILDEVSKDDRISQRALSERLGVALGLTNLYLKRLINKGYIKVKGIPGTRYFYYLTPRGFAEKSALSVRYMQFSWRYYQELRALWRVQFEQLYADGARSVVICGTGEMAELAYLSIRESNLQVAGVIDDARVGANFCGHRVEAASALKRLVYDRVILGAAGGDRSDEERARGALNKLGVPQERVVGLAA